MTTQEAYEAIREWFGRDDTGFGHDDVEGVCRYRVDYDPASPQRCAVGCLIADEDYLPTWDKLAMPATALPLDSLGLADVSETFLSKAQRIHDCIAGQRGETLRQKKARLLTSIDTLAREFGLVVIGS